MLNNSLSIYIHFPYCAQRCPYCDFNVHIRKDLPEQDFINALIYEARNRSQDSEWTGKVVKSIFFGGGTPSLFSAHSISTVITYLNSIFTFDSKIEISIEANPEDVSHEYAQKLSQTQINRISLGVQSLAEPYLKRLGRIHSAVKAKQAFLNLRKAGLENINLDFMFALPNQSLCDFEIDLRAALELAPQHLSFYNLTIEKGTHFFQQRSQGKLSLPDDSLSSDMMFKLIETLTNAGYSHYEVSNFALPSYESVHNQRYWQMQDYLGLGPGAHSAFLAGALKMYRSANISDPDQYIKNPTMAKAWSDKVEGNHFIFEKLMLGLRTDQGVNLNEYLSVLDPRILDKFLKQINQFTSEGFLRYESSTLRARRPGLLILDSLLAEIAEKLELS